MCTWNVCFYITGKNLESEEATSEFFLCICSIALQTNKTLFRVKIYCQTSPYLSRNEYLTAKWIFAINPNTSFMGTENASLYEEVNFISFVGFTEVERGINRENKCLRIEGLGSNRLPPFVWNTYMYQFKTF